MAHPKIQQMLDLAARDIKRLRYAQTCEEGREAWIAFLEHANRAINRLEQYARTSGQIGNYKDLIAKEIWQYEVAKYMRLVRNSHEHGVQDTEADDPFNERVAFPAGHIITGQTLYAVTVEGDTVVVPASAPGEHEGGPEVRVIRLRPNVQMVPVVDKNGDVILPPSVPGLESEDEPDVAAAARVYLAWIAQRIATFR